jgi:hypothetical protein
MGSNVIEALTCIFATVGHHCAGPCGMLIQVDRHIKSAKGKIVSSRQGGANSVAIE